jgi:hypothetical protein
VLEDGVTMKTPLRFPVQTPVQPVADAMGLVDTPLRAAIAGKRLIQLRYEGKVRIAEPHDYGVQGDRERVLIYQLRVPGSTDTKGTRGWRLLDVPKIAECRVLDETFPGSRGAAEQRHHEWDVLYARVT